MCFLYQPALNLAKFIEISHCKDTKMLLGKAGEECVHKINIKKLHLSMGYILLDDRTPPNFCQCVTYGKSQNIVNAYSQVIFSI